MKQIDKNEKYEIHVQGGFSEMKKIKSFTEVIQVDSINLRTRNRIYSNLLLFIESIEDKEIINSLIMYIYMNILSLSIDDIPLSEFGIGIDYDKVFSMIKEIIINEDYNEIYDFIIGIIQGLTKIECYPDIKIDFVNRINDIFIEENVGYRIVNDIIIDLMDDNTVKSINETMNNQFEVVKKHYNKAVEKLYGDHDFENAIKESICSVEAMCQIINGSKENLNVALKNLKVNIHPALKEGYIKLYAYTCDENGTRHANGIGEKNATFEEAQYMLVSCSAFVNYLQRIYMASI